MSDAGHAIGRSFSQPDSTKADVTMWAAKC